MPLCNCSNCAFYNPDGDPKPNHGLCRRRSPVIIDESFSGVFPVVMDTDYCGDWESWSFWNMKEEHTPLIDIIGSQNEKENKENG